MTELSFQSDSLTQEQSDSLTWWHKALKVEHLNANKHLSNVKVSSASSSNFLNDHSRALNHQKQYRIYETTAEN